MEINNDKDGFTVGDKVALRAEIANQYKKQIWAHVFHSDSKKIDS